MSVEESVEMLHSGSPSVLLEYLKARLAIVVSPSKARRMSLGSIR